MQERKSPDHYLVAHPAATAHNNPKNRGKRTNPNRDHKGAANQSRGRKPADNPNRDRKGAANKLNANTTRYQGRTLSEAIENKNRRNEPADDITNPAPNRPPKHDWADPNVPAGNAPPLPRWPLVASGVAFALWLGFLVAMAIIRTRTVSF